MVHERAIVVDAHAHPKSNEARSLRLGEKTGEIEVDLVSMKEGGLDAVFFSVPLLGTPPGPSQESEQILTDIESLKNEVDTYGALAEFAQSPEDIFRIHESGRELFYWG